MLFPITLLVYIVTTSFSSNSACNNPVVFQPKQEFGFSAGIYKVSKEDGKLLLYAKTRLINNTSDTIKFMSMSCSYQDEYGTNTKLAFVPLVACDKNIRSIITIAPNKSFEREVMLESKVSVNILEGLKIGFSFVRVEKLQDSLRTAFLDLHGLEWGHANDQHQFFPMDTSFNAKKSFTVLNPWGKFQTIASTVTETVVWSNYLDSSLNAVLRE